MKHLIILSLFFLAACASHHPKLVIRATSPPAVEPIESVRYAEVLRAYYVGRCVDPNQLETMHEQHPMYRIEAAARWNLHPGPCSTPNLLNPPADAAFALPLTNDVVIAEINRQREATARVMQEAARLTQAFDELQKLVTELKTVAVNQVSINARLTEAEQRLAAFQEEQEKRLITASPAPATNDTPTSVPESQDDSQL